MTSNREMIFVDIDETSARTIEDGVYPIVNSKYGTTFAHDTTCDYRDVFGNEILENGEPLPLQRKIEVFNGAILQDRGRNLIRPVVGSVEKILELTSGYDVGMLTARHSILVDYTSEWVRHYYSQSICKVLFSNCFHGGKKRKSDICVEEGVRIMIEDDMDYALELARKRILVPLLRKPWNEHRTEKHRNIKRINTWDELKI